MYQNQELVVRILARLPVRDVREAYANVVRGWRDPHRIVDYMIKRGWEPVDNDGDLTMDGREVVHINGKSWALKPEVHAQRLAEARAKQQSQSTHPTTPPTVCTTLIDGQLCGGTLIRAAVCPRCALGKSGVAATMTCDVCGHVTAIMRGDS